MNDERRETIAAAEELMIRVNSAKSFSILNSFTSLVELFSFLDNTVFHLDPDEWYSREAECAFR